MVWFKEKPVSPQEAMVRSAIIELQESRVTFYVSRAVMEDVEEKTGSLYIQNRLDSNQDAKEFELRGQVNGRDKTRGKWIKVLLDIVDSEVEFTSNKILRIKGGGEEHDDILHD